MPHIDIWEPCFLTKFPDGSQNYTFNVLWIQEEGTQIRMSEWSKSFTLTQNVGRGFILCSTPPKQWTVWERRNRWRCFLRVLCPTRKPVTALDSVLLKDRNLALAPREGPEMNTILSLGITKTPPPYPMLVRQTTSNPSSYTLPRKSRETLKYYVRHTRITLTMKTCVYFLYLCAILALKTWSKSCQKYKTLSLHLLLLTGLHFLGVRFVTSPNLNVCTAVTRQNTLPMLE
jgi:hypothetical protein